MGDDRDKTLKSFPQDSSLPGFADSDNSSLPTFPDISAVNSESFDVPLPPPELQARPTIVRLQDIEDDFLSGEPKGDEISSIKDELNKKRKKPIFVNIEEYGLLLQTVRSTHTNLKSFSDIFTNIENIHATQHTHLKKINETFEDIQRKLIMIDNNFFEKEEE